MNEVWRSDNGLFTLRLPPKDDFSPVHASKTVLAARLLERSHVPAVRLVPDIVQPLKAWSNREATLWYWAEDEGELRFEELGRSLRLLHGIDPSVANVKADEMIATVEDRLNRLARSGRSNGLYLSLLAGQLARSRERVLNEVQLTRGIIHGDIRITNVVMSAGSCVLLDLDSLSIGPILHDLWRLVLDYRRGYVDDRSFQLFCGGYGSDPSQSHLLDEYVKFVYLLFSSIAEMRDVYAPSSMNHLAAESLRNWWFEGADVASVPAWSEAWHS